MTVRSKDSYHDNRLSSRGGGGSLLPAATKKDHRLLGN